MPIGRGTVPPFPEPATIAALFDGAGDALATFDASGELLFSNDVMKTRFSLDERRTPVLFEQLATPELREAYREIWERAKRQAGPVRWSSFSGRRIFDDFLQADRSSGGAFFLGRDITDQHEARQRLERDALSFRKVTEHFGFGLGLFRSSGLTYANAAFLDTMGLSYETLVFPIEARSVLARVHPDDRPSVADWWLAELSGLEPARQEHLVVRVVHPAHASPRIVDLTARVIELPMGERC
ncbi:MAG: hypothetical protein HC923_10650 [Myxococcales bacterium]|nr:hypothetical protein [Myxococcales bacterium]